MNYKFEKQSKRKPLMINDVHESRFEIKNLWPENLSNNKKVVRNIMLDKYAERETSWVNKDMEKPEYESIDVEKYKFKKV